MATQKTIVTSNEIEQFADLFQGYEGAYGQYIISQKDDSGKVKGAAKTIPKAAELSDYAAHLSGETGIGIIPLLKDEKVWFGAIDIDIKGAVKLKEDIFILEARIRHFDLPVVVCRSKSDGVHLYVFASEPVSARLMQQRCIEIASLLGYGGCEIFPKQVTRVKDTDYGNWINLPMFGGARQCVHNRKQFDRLEDFIRIAQSMRISGAELRKFEIPLSNLFSDGPPCLQQLATQGFTEGSRNNALLNVAIYYKKKDPDDWQDKIYTFNQEHLSPALPHEEVTTLAKSCGKKDYNYTCKQSPIAQHCNRKECVKREFGVSGGKENDTKLPYNSITKYSSKDSHRWVLHTSEVSIEFSTEELASFEAHRKKMIEAMNVVLPTIKQDSFMRQLNELLSNVEVVYEAEELSETGHAMQAFLSWFENTHSAETHDEMIMDKWYLDAKTGNILFQGKSLLIYLDKSHKIKPTNMHKFWRKMKDEFKLTDDRVTIKGKRHRVLVYAGYEFQDKKPLHVPDVDKAIEVF